MWYVPTLAYVWYLVTVLCNICCILESSDINEDIPKMDVMSVLNTVWSVP